jgi:predicted dehydrogenase
MAKKQLNIALIGCQFMGKAHSNAYRQVSRFFDLPVQPVMKVVCGITMDEATTAAAKYGWQETSDNWREVVNRPDIDIIDIATPNNTHGPIAIAAAKAGKHVLCEKPLSTNLTEAKAMWEAAKSSGVVNATSYCYRRVPAVTFAKKLIDEGRIGKIYHFRGNYLQDWIVDPKFPLVWRLQKEVAGSGAHGDLAAHTIDFARYLVGDITEVSGLMETFIKQRPKLAASDDRLGGVASDEMGEVTVDDASMFLARFENGAIGTFEASRFCLGRKNYNRWEINGSKGSIVFNVERMNELEVYFQDDAPDVRGFRTIQTTDSCHPYTGNYWPVAHIIGYEHTFINQAKDFLEAIAAGKPFSPSFEDGVKNQAILEAVEKSSETRQWVSPEF